MPTEERSVGGDWYDLFTLPSGAFWIVAGDVAGHGLHATVVMGRIRSALRAYTLLDLPPQEVLHLVDRKVDHFEIGSIATVACTVMEPPYETMTLSLAGHPPPVVPRSPDGPPSSRRWSRDLPSATLRGGGPLGHRGGRTPGAVVAFYTDGLVERRNESLSVGLERLCAAVSPGPAGTVARDIMHALVADTVPEDDIALVVIRRTDGG